MNTTNKIAILVTMILLMLSSVMAADSSSLSATLSNYEPTPASPGKYVTAYIKLENSGSAAAKNVILKVIPEFPLTIDNGQKTEEKIGILEAQSIHKTEFKLKVDENAVQGTNKIKVRYNIDENQEVWVTQELNINIQTQDAVLSIQNVETTPNEIVPGEEAKIKIKLENMADSLLTDIAVQLDLSSDETPLAPIGSASEKSIYQINPGSSKELIFDVIALPDAASNIYKIPITLTYYDNIGTQYTKEDYIGIKINSKPEIKVMIDSTDLLTDKTIGNIVLKIVNKGLSDVKLMSLKVGESSDFEILSATSEQYIGNVDSDDFETIDFDIKIKSESPIKVPIQIDYRDDNNKEYSQSYELNLALKSSKELGQSSGNKSIIIIVIIIIVVGIWFYRRHKKKKKAQKKV